MIPTYFTEQGYTEDTKFKVIKADGPFKEGDIITLDVENSDEWSEGWAYFKNEAGDVYDLYLPRRFGLRGVPELEVYKEEDETVTKELTHVQATPFEAAGYTRDTRFRFIGKDKEYPVGTIVRIYEDFNTIAPKFTDGKESHYLALPGLCDPGEEDLEVYVEEEDNAVTHFEKAGYTKDTKFKVIEHGGDFPYGSIVVLLEDDGSTCPFFKLEGTTGTSTDDCSYLNYGCFYLPGFSEDGDQIEVYIEEKQTEEETKTPLKEHWINNVPIPLFTSDHKITTEKTNDKPCTITHNLTIKGITHVLTPAELSEVYETLYKAMYEGK